MHERQKLELQYWKTSGIKNGIDLHKEERTKCWKVLKELYEVKKISVALDVGCGAMGGMSLAVPAKKWLLLDPLIDEFRKLYKNDNNGKKYINAFNEDIPLDENSVDVVFSTNALDHVNDPDKCLSEIYRVLKPEGYFYLWTDCREKSKTDIIHSHAFKLDVLSKQLKNIGFKIIKEDKIIPGDIRWNTIYLTYIGVLKKC